MPIRHALKTGMAAALALLVYRYVPGLQQQPNSPAALWAVVTAILVMQANFGGSFQASLQRVVGTVVGGFIGALTAWSLGANFVTLAGAVTVTFLALTWAGLSDSLRVACVTVVLVMLARGAEISPWEMGLERSRDVLVGIGVALLTHTLLFPVSARAQLRASLAEALRLAGEVYHALTVALPEGVKAEAARLALEAALVQNRSLLSDIKSEPRQARPDLEELVALVSGTEAIAECLAALDGFPGARPLDLPACLRPVLDDLARDTEGALRWLQESVRGKAREAPPALERALAEADRAFGRAASEGAVCGRTGEDVLALCALFYNLRAVTRTVKGLVCDLRHRSPTLSAPPLPAAVEGRRGSADAEGPTR